MVQIDGVFVIDNGKRIPIIQYANKLNLAAKKGLKGSASARSVALRLMSDFIASRSGLKEATTSANFFKPSARPDQQGSLTAFLKVYGVELQKTSVTGGAQAYVELKQKTSSARSVAITSFSLPRSSEGEESFLNLFNLQRGFKEEDLKIETFLGTKINQISSSELHKWVSTQEQIKTSLITQIEQKFENFTLIDYLDKDRGGRAKIKVLANAAKELDLITNFTNNVTLTARQVKSSSGSVSIKIDANLSDVAYNKFLEKAVDATAKFHESLGANFSTRFLKYAVSSFDKSSKLSVSDFLEAIISLAKEFKEGSQTPIVYETVIKKLPLAASSQTIELVNDIKSKKELRSQKVISDAQLTALVQKEVEKRMPKGPLRGPPLSPLILTYRTGTFVNSIKVVQDFRDSIITYYYAPNYKVHEKRGARAPRLLLQASIRETVKAVYSQKFRILMGF